jgi:flagellar export protein FliJ
MSGVLSRLDRLLHLRNMAERERARHLAEAIRSEERQREGRDAASALLERCGEQVAAAAGEVQSAGTLRQLGLAIWAAAREARRAEANHAASAEALQCEQEKFNEARKERRVVERYQERRREADNLEEVRQEQKMMDEIERHQRTRRGER